MTDNTKMLEGKLWAFLHDSIHEAYKKLSTTGTSNEYYALLDSIAAKIADDVDARFLKAAHAAALPPGFVAVPMTKDRIKEEWDAFIAYPEGSGKLYVTTTSALLFAYLISSMTADAMLAASPDTQP